MAGGPVLRRDLKAALAHAPCLVAADGGADRALALGQVPDAVIGDLDSISAVAQARLGARVHHRLPIRTAPILTNACAILRHRSSLRWAVLVAGSTMNLRCCRYWCGARGGPSC